MLSRLLCFIGIHKWYCAYDPVAKRDYMRCVRSPNCRYKNWMYEDAR